MSDNDKAKTVFSNRVASEDNRSIETSSRQQGEERDGDNMHDDQDFEELPVIGHKSKILDFICQNQIIICISETGSGKTTQIPQFCADYAFPLDSVPGFAPHGIQKCEAKRDDNISLESKSDDEIPESDPGSSPSPGLESDPRSVPRLVSDEKDLGPSSSDNQISKNSSSMRVVAVTQPRRVAAITVAQRVAAERHGRVGDEVGYAVRFDDCTSVRTRIKYMTDGILLRECIQDPSLSRYHVVILDEAHERSLSTDILFGLVKAACVLRPSLRVVVTSATLDADKLSLYFNKCPVLQIPGRMYPVDIYHSKARQTMTMRGPSNSSYVEAAVEIVLKIHKKDEEGHILVFLTGQEEIEKACSLIRAAIQEEGSTESRSRDLLVLPLYASLSSDAQQRAFQKPVFLKGEYGYRGDRNNNRYIRKCLVSTNMAETSVTVPQVRFVVDSGYVKQKTYDPTRHMESLVVVPISQVAAQQRAGRAGRTGPGQCYRLYSSECLQSMAQETVPEILRANMGNAVLHLKVLKVNNGDVLGFDFLDPPSEDQILEALTQLHMLGAIDSFGEITEMGMKMSRLPLDPNLSRVLLESIESDVDCVEEALAVAGMMSSEALWVIPRQIRNSDRNGDKHQISGSLNQNDTSEYERAMQAHSRLRSPFGDHITYLHIFQTCWDLPERSGNVLQREWCEKNFLRFKSLQSAKKIRDQLRGEMKKFIDQNGSSQMKNENNEVNDKGVGRERGRERGSRNSTEIDRKVCQALAAGYFSNIARNSANSDSIFYSLPLSNQGSGGNAIKNNSDYSYDNEEKILLHVHHSSVLTHCSSSACVTAGCWTKQPQYVLYQELIHGAKIMMRHVIWIDKYLVHKYRSKYVPVSHPLLLSGRNPLKTDNGNNNENKSDDVSTKKTSKSTENSISNCSKENSITGIKRALQSDVNSSEMEVKNKVSAVNDARRRFLARKKGN